MDPIQVSISSDVFGILLRVMFAFTIVNCSSVYIDNGIIDDDAPFAFNYVVGSDLVDVDIDGDNNHTCFRDDGDGDDLCGADIDGDSAHVACISVNYYVND